MADIKQTVFYNLKHKVGGLQLLIICIIMVSTFYFSISTRWIPPDKKINHTTENNQTVELQAVYSYAYKDYVVKTREFEYENTQIPKSSYELEGAFLTIFLVIVLVYLYSKREKGEILLTKEEIEEKAKEYLKRMIDNGTILSYDILLGAKLSMKQIDSGQSNPNWWYIAVDVITDKGEPEHRLLGFHPYGDGHLVFDLKLLREFTDRDVCSHCGLFYDMKMISPTGYKEWFENFYPRRMQ